jgi:DNA-binding MarR family transcriptional regulator
VHNIFIFGQIIVRMRPEETIDFHIKYTWQNITKMYNAVAARFGGSMAVGYILLNIDLENGTPSTALGPKMGMEATSLSRILKSMEEKGLIERKPNPLDGRGVFICLTPFGIAKREDAKAAVLTFNQTLYQNIDAEDLEAFFRVTGTINELIDNKEIYTETHETNH